MKYAIGLIRSAPKKPPIFLRYRSSEGLIISTVALAIFTDIFLYGVSHFLTLVNIQGNHPDLAIRAGGASRR